ncbi:MAG: hypothetical protein ACJ79K_11505 [Gemmatimonadaceae bacterium]
MGIIPPNVHRILDYLAIIAFALAPTLFHLHGNTRMLAYALAIVHLIVTLATDFNGTGRRPLPFPVHGYIELVVGIVLAVVPFVRHWTVGAGKFYPAIGIVLILVWLLTRYRYTVVRDSASTAA